MKPHALRQYFARKNIPRIILLTMLIITVTITVMIYRSGKEAERLIFNQQVEVITGSVERRLATYTALLRAGAGLYYSQNYIDLASWQRFANELDIRNTYPGLQGIGFTRRILPQEIAGVTSTVRRQGHTNFTINPSYPRNEYHAILYLEPLDARNRAAIGYDMFTEPTRRQAMERARDNDAPALSGKVSLIQEISEDKQNGFLIYYPVYRTKHNLVENRRANLVGYVYSPFRAGDFMVTAIGNRAQDIKISVYDGSTTSPKALLYTFNSELNTGDQPLVIAKHIKAAGHTWTLVMSSDSKNIVTPQEQALPFIFFGGILISLTFFGLSLAQQRDREAMITAMTDLQRANDRSSFLANAGKILASSIDYEETLENLARTTVPSFADWCAIDVMENGEIDRLIVAHRDPKKVELAKKTREDYPIDWNAPHGLPAVLKTGKTEFYPQITDEMMTAGAKDPEHLRLLRSLNLTSAIIVPLKITGTVVGAITLISSDSGYTYTEQDLVTAESVAARASLHMANAKLVRELQRAVHIRDDFMAIASHELKTPLTSVRGYLQLLTRKKIEEKEIHDYIERANLYTERLADLIEELLDVSRIESGKLELKREVFPLIDVINDGIESVRYINHKHQIITAGDLNIVVQGDKTRLEQVIINLLSNAIKYSPDADKITVTLSHQDDDAQVSIQDFGIGIPAESLDNIFNRFYRVEHPSHTFSGLGIGLYISKRIIERHGGRMWVDSKEGEGSNFHFTLPLA